MRRQCNRRSTRKQPYINRRQQRATRAQEQRANYEKLVQTVEEHYNDSLEFDQARYPIFCTEEYQNYYAKWETIMKDEWKLDAAQRNYKHMLVRLDIIKALRVNPDVKFRFQ